MTFATRKRAIAYLETKGFTFNGPAVMGAAPYRNGASYAWITEDWSPKHRALRLTVHIAGAA